MFVVKGVDDVFALISCIEAYQEHQVTVIVDGLLPTLQKSTVAMLARVLPPTATVVLWGVQGVEELLRADGWHYVPRSESELQLVRAALGEDAHHARTLPPPQQRGAQPADIVIAEDDSAFRASLARLLRSRGHEVRTAPDGYSALNLCMQRPPDLLITDRDMPSVDGAQLARLIKDMLGEVAPPVVIVSSLPGADVPEAEAVLTKEEARNELLPTVARLLGKHKLRHHCG